MSRLLGSGRRKVSIQLLVVTLLVAAAGLAREIAIASALGLGAGLDHLATTIAFALLLSSSLTNASTSALMPSIVQSRASGNGSEHSVEATALVFTVACGVVLGVVAMFASGQLNILFGSTQGGGVASDEVAIGVVVSAAVIAGAARGTVGAIFNARSRFVLPAAVPIAGSSVVVIAATALGAGTAWKLGNWFAAGLLVEALILLVAAQRLIGSLRPTRHALSGLRPVGGRWFFSLSSALVFGASPVIDLAIANQIATGSAAALSLASRIPLAVAALAAAVVATPVFTTMSEAATKSGSASVVAIARHECTRALRFGLPLAGLVAVIGFPVALIAYSNGEMSAADAQSVAVTQAIYCVSIAPYLAGVLISRGLMALGRHRVVFVAALIGAIANLGLDIVLSRIWGRNGIALATGAVYTLTMASMWWWLARLRLRQDDQVMP